MDSDDKLKDAIEQATQGTLAATKRCSKCRGLCHTPDGIRCVKCRGSGIEQAAKGLAGGIDRVDIKK